MALALEPREVLEEAARQIDPEEVVRISGELVEKSLLFQSLLAPRSLAAFGAGERRTLLRAVFATRRRTAAFEAAAEPAAFAGMLGRLLDEREPLERRFSGFVAAASIAGAVGADAARDLAAECLHFSAPARYRLWTRWIYDPANGSGVLPIALQEDLSLPASDPGACYLAVSAALDRLPAPGSAFVLDAYLALLYGVYARATTRRKMTDEFNKAIPAIPELARRLLGVHHLHD